MGLTYTAPLKTLRITGAPRTEFSVKDKPVDFEWGTAADEIFLSADDAEGFGDESSDPHDVYLLLLKDRKEEATVAFCAKHLHHYSPLVRTWAAKRLKEINSSEAHGELAEAATHKDPRVRRAAFDGVSGYDNWGRPFKSDVPAEFVSAEILPAILKTLNDPEASWWEKDGALFALGRAKPEDIRKAWPLIEKYSKHDEWYLRESAFWAIAGLAESITGPEFEKLGEIYGESRHVFARSSYDAGFRSVLRSKPAALEGDNTSKVVGMLGRTTHDVPVASGYGTAGVHEATHRTMMILKHFDPEVYKLMVDDFVTYLGLWEPYYQHSVWLITGSKWQPGILKVLDGLGADGKPVVEALKKVLARFDTFD